MAPSTDRYLSYLTAERAARNLYRALAELTSGERREALLELADIEQAHAQHWSDLLAGAGAAVPPDDSSLEPSDQQVLQRARSLSLDAVLPDLEQAERDAQGVYDDEPDAAAGMADDERVHEQVLHRLRGAGVTGTDVPAAGKSADQVREMLNMMLRS